eukprot:g4618.t1
MAHLSPLERNEQLRVHLQETLAELSLPSSPLSVQSHSRSSHSPPTGIVRPTLQQQLSRQRAEKVKRRLEIEKKKKLDRREKRNTLRSRLVTAQMQLNDLRSRCKNEDLFVKQLKKNRDTLSGEFKDMDSHRSEQLATLRGKKREILDTKLRLLQISRYHDTLLMMEKRSKGKNVSLFNKDKIKKRRRKKEKEKQLHNQNEKNIPWQNVLKTFKNTLSVYNEKLEDLTNVQRLVHNERKEEERRLQLLNIKVREAEALLEKELVEVKKRAEQAAELRLWMERRAQEAATLRSTKAVKASALSAIGFLEGKARNSNLSSLSSKLQKHERGFRSLELVTNRTIKDMSDADEIAELFNGGIELYLKDICENLDDLQRELREWVEKRDEIALHLEVVRTKGVSLKKNNEENEERSDSEEASFVESKSKSRKNETVSMEVIDRMHHKVEYEKTKRRTSITRANRVAQLYSTVEQTMSNFSKIVLGKFGKDMLARERERGGVLNRGGRFSRKSSPISMRKFSSRNVLENVESESPQISSPVSSPVADKKKFENRRATWAPGEGEVATSTYLAVNLAMGGANNPLINHSLDKARWSSDLHALRIVLQNMTQVPLQSPRSPKGKKGGGSGGKRYCFEKMGSGSSVILDEKVTKEEAQNFAGPLFSEEKWNAASGGENFVSRTIFENAVKSETSSPPLDTLNDNDPWKSLSIEQQWNYVKANNFQVVELEDSNDTEIENLLIEHPEANAIVAADLDMPEFTLPPIIGDVVLSLDLSGNELKNFTVTGSNSFLRRLNLSGNPLSRRSQNEESGFCPIGNTGSLSKLLWLDLSFVEKIGPLSEVNGWNWDVFAVLRHLNLENCNLTDSDFIETQPIRLPNLLEMNLNGNEIENIKVLKTLELLQKLENLDMRDNPVMVSMRQRDFEAAVETVLPKLVTLNNKILPKSDANEMMKKSLATVEGIQESVQATGSAMEQMDFKLSKCSCLEGNPCSSQYVCKDWKNRYAIAKKVREEKGMRLQPDVATSSSVIDFVPGS